MTLARQATFTAAALLLAVPAMAQTSPASAFDTVEADYEAWLLRENPEAASMAGEDRYADRLSDLSLAAQDRRAAEAAALLARLEAVAVDQLAANRRTDHAIMRRQLREAIEANRFPQRMMLFTTYAGWHQSFASLADYLPFRTGADYRAWLARLAAYPAHNRAAIAVTRAGLAGGLALPCAVLDGYERTISGVVTEDVRQSRLYAPFTRSRPADVIPTEWAAMQARAQVLIRDMVNPAYREHLRFFAETYRPRCTASISVSELPQGPEYYAFRIRQETTTDLTAAEIHELGLAEVARIRAEMEALARRAGFADRAAFVHHLRTDPRYFAATPEAYLAHAAWITRRIDGQMPSQFGRLPRLPYTIRAVPAETAEGTTTAYYGPGSPSNGVAGTYYVNTSRLDQRPLWELPALSLHEAVPGHHHQIALQQELELPRWRRDFTGFTAFTEGWGLYAERLGIEMGLYDSPAADMGRLSYEMWRACRLVVDTGIHSRGWSRDQAIAFMRDNTAMTEANIAAEVNRYISWPGQALGYKIGELRIRALRAEAENALGPRFDRRAFHDMLLAHGAVPLDVLEAQVREWIAIQRGR